jgi:hypothetical protein
MIFWIFIGLLAFFEIAYVIGANGFLRSGQIQKLVNTRPEKLRLDFDSAWTVIPGWVNIEKFRIEGVDGKVRWHAELESAQALINLLALPNRSFQTLVLRGKGGLFRLTPAEPVPEDPNKKPGNPRGPFWIRLGGLSLDDFNEIAVMDYVYRGSGFIGGGFDLWPGRILEIDSADIAFEGGQVFLGERTLSSRLEGRIEADVSRWLPKEETSGAMIDKLSARVKLDGELENADFLNHYLESIPWLKILGVSGKFSVDTEIENGAFSAPSTASIVATRIGAGMERYQAEGSGRIQWRVDDEGEKPLLKMGLSLDTYVGMDAEKKEKLAEGRGLRLSADSYDLNLRKIFSNLSDLSASIVLGEMQIPDLRFLNNFVPISEHFQVLEGQAELGGRFSVSTRRATEAGLVRLSAREVRARFRKTEVSGDFGFTARVQDTTEGANLFDVGGSRLAFTNVKVLEKDKQSSKKPVPPWSGEVSLQKGAVDLSKDLVFGGEAELNFDDARPVLALLANTSRVARLVTRFADMKKLRGKSEFSIGPDLVAFDHLSLKSSDVDLRARIRLKNAHTRALAFIKYGLLELALSIRDDDTESKIIKSEKWYQEKLESFDGP